MRLLLAMTAVLFACMSSHAQEAGSLRRGEALLAHHCSSCHAIGRSGASPRADAPAFRILGRKYPVETLEEALAEGLMSGHPDMPEFSFNAADVGAIIAYLKSIQERPVGVTN